MESKSAERVCTCFIFAVSGHRMADPAGVGPDLVFPACFKIEFDTGIFLTFLFNMLEGAAVA